MGFDLYNPPLHSPIPPIMPPRFSYVDDEGKPDGEKEIAVIAEHYNEFVELLDGGKGYEPLLEMKRRIRDHLDTLEEEVERHWSRFHFCEDLVAGIENRIQRIAESESGDDEDIERILEEVMERPLGEHWSAQESSSNNLPSARKENGPTPDREDREDRGARREVPSRDLENAEQGPNENREGEWRGPKGAQAPNTGGPRGGPPGGRPPTREGPPWDGPHEDGWTLYKEENLDEWVPFEPEEKQREPPETIPEHSEILITYTPVGGNSDREYKEEHLERYDQPVFRGNETWSEVLDLAKIRLSARENDYEERSRTAQALRFRLTTAKTVLYRFEAFGSVELMDEEEAKKHAEQGPPDIFYRRPALRRHADRIIQKYQNAPQDLPTTMTNFMAWIGPEGENAVTQLQTALREVGLSDEYNHGDPESFCDLVEQLYTTHYGSREDP